MLSRRHDCILLAAGLSSRASGHKLLATVDGVPLIARAVRTALAAARRVIVVVGHDSDAVRAAAYAAVARNEHARLLPVLNDRFREGMFGSIQSGMRTAFTEWFYVSPADLPDLSPAIYERLAIAAAAIKAPEDDGVAVIPHYRGTRGHPVLMHRSVLSASLAEPIDGGPMRTILERYPTTVLGFDTDAVVADLDTDDAFEARRSRSTGDE